MKSNSVLFFRFGLAHYRGSGGTENSRSGAIAVDGTTAANFPPVLSEITPWMSPTRLTPWRTVIRATIAIPSQNQVPFFQFSIVLMAWFGPTLHFAIAIRKERGISVNFQQRPFRLCLQNQAAGAGFTLL